MEPCNPLNKPLIASFFLFINFAHLIYASSENTLVVRPFLKGGGGGGSSGDDSIYKNSHSQPVVGGSSGTSKPSDGLKKLCDKTDYPSLCMTTLTPFFKGKTDIISVLQMSINAAIQQTKSAISVAQKLVKAPGTPGEDVSNLKECIETYTDALDNFNNAKEAIPEKDTGTINTMLSAAIADYETCNDEFGGSGSPIGKYGEKLTDMTSNCLVFAAMIK
ncbi:pectinesterase inhibitor [Mercurialis annua]|uniref:pectinesterase inhibitor n=1 Tax=Mercurialis annua TaxID=3986 RepID=UPI0021608AA9|nr:pectinesterase inhibitor [Mercurialis annua]